MSLDSDAQLLQAALSLLRGGAFGSQQMGAWEEDRLMRPPEVRRLTGMSCSALHDQIAHGQFPRSIKIGPQASWSARAFSGRIARRVGGSDFQ